MPDVCDYLRLEGAHGTTIADLVPDNAAAKELPNALAAAHNSYGTASAMEVEQDPIVLFVVQPGMVVAVLCSMLRCDVVVQWI